MVIHIRQHVFRQPPPEFASKRLFVVLAGIAADDLLCRSLIEAAALRHRLTRLDCALDFAQLNSIALLLDLAVLAPKKHQFASLVVCAEVTRFVHPLRNPPRVRMLDKRCRRFSGAL